jgi:hypothetical protein
MISLLFQSVLAALCTAILLNYLTYYSWLFKCLLSIVSCYLVSYFDGSEYSANNTRISPTLQHWRGWQKIMAYFPTSIKADDDVKLPLDTDYQYIVAASPHGINSFNHFIMMTNAAGFLSSILPVARRDLAASILFRIPVIRELILGLGNIDASKKYVQAALEYGYSLFVYPGGELEQLKTDSNSDIIEIPHSHRRGFIKLALQYGCRILPVYTFGEEQLYHTSNLFIKQRMKLAKRFRIAITLNWGIWKSFLPLSSPLVTVVGKPIITDSQAEHHYKALKSAHRIPPGVHYNTTSPIGGRLLKPREVSEAEIDRVLKLYLTELQSLFDRHKHSVPGYSNKQLLIT